jgi:hypothetical protein
LGSGDGRFGSPTFYEAGRLPVNVAVADFNGDGADDIATVNYYSDTSTMLTGNGDGSFNQAGKLPGGYSPFSLLALDVNGDRRQDLVFSGHNEETVIALLGTGEATFSDRYGFTVGWRPRAIAAGDFNQDGQVDLVSSLDGPNPDRVSILLNLGTPLTRVELDVKPETFPNSVNPRSWGVVPVAVLGEDTVDVREIDVATLAFGPGGAPIAHRRGHYEDVNRDGYTDLVLHFRTQETGIECDVETVSLVGTTLDGLPVEGTDTVQPVGCRSSAKRPTAKRPADGRSMQSHETATRPQQKR